jgi:hypothetical protein
LPALFCLPYSACVLLDALRQTKAAINAGDMQDDSKKALIPAVEGCGIQIQSLDDVIVKVLPASGDSWPQDHGQQSWHLVHPRKIDYTNKQTTVSSHSISSILGKSTYALHQQVDYGQ